MEYITLVVLDDEGNKVGEVKVPKKEFSTGSKGFHKSTKLELDGKRYQCNFQLVRIGSAYETE